MSVALRTGLCDLAAALEVAIVIIVQAHSRMHSTEDLTKQGEHQSRSQE